MISRSSSLPKMPSLPDGLILQPVTPLHIQALQKLNSPLLAIIESKKSIWAKGKYLIHEEKFDQLWCEAVDILFLHFEKRKFCFSIHLFFVTESALRALLADDLVALRKAARLFKAQYSSNVCLLCEAAFIHFCRAVAPRPGVKGLELP